MSYEEDLKVARKAARLAADVIREHARQGVNISKKAKNDLVTNADVASEKCIIEHISKAFPNDTFLAEESTGVIELSEQRTWIIDPIDGTTNFAHGFPFFCVSIALWENKEAKVGVVLEVNSGQMFYATVGGGAFKDGIEIAVSDIDDPSDALLGTGFPYKDLHLVDNYLKLFKKFMDETHGVRRPGSAALDLCMLASGKVDAFYEYGLSPWDVAAAALIVKEAGGKITDWIEGDEWLFGQRIIASNGHLHNYVKEAIHNTFTKEEDLSVLNSTKQY